MQPTYRAGIDYFPRLAGTEKTMKCKACQEEMNVERNVLRTKGKFGDIPEDLQRYEDIFTCQYAGVDWHSQIIALLREIDHTSSQKLTALLESEIVEICRTRHVTKPLSGWLF